MFSDDVAEWYNIKGNEIMGYSYGALGDAFAMISFSVLMAKKLQCTLKLSAKSNNRKTMFFKTILPLLQENEHVIFTAEEATPFTKLFCTRKHLDPYTKTITQWKPNTSKKICYHYDTRTKHKRSERFPKEEEEEFFLDWVKNGGCECVDIGYPMPFDEVIQVSSECQAFVGIESGISHIMHSVGIPVFIREWNDGNRTKNYHPNKEYTLFKSFYDLEKMF